MFKSNRLQPLRLHVACCLLLLLSLVSFGSSARVARLPLVVHLKAVSSLILQLPLVPPLLHLFDHLGE